MEEATAADIRHMAEVTIHIHIHIQPTTAPTDIGKQKTQRPFQDTASFCYSSSWDFCSPIASARSSPTVSSVGLTPDM